MSSIRAIRPGRMTRNRGRVAAECALLADRAECPLLLALATIAHQKLAIVCALQIESEITRGLTEWLVRRRSAACPVTAAVGPPHTPTSIDVMLPTIAAG